MSTIWTGVFWRAAAERCIGTFAQALLAVIGVQAIAIYSIDWPAALAIATTAALLSLLKSVVVGTLGADGSPAIGGTEVLPERGGRHLRTYPG